MTSESDALRERVTQYLRTHHTMTLATCGAAPWRERPDGSAASGSAAGERNEPHAATVFYAVNDRLHLVFLSKTTSVHGVHIGKAALVAVTVSEDYADWQMIQGVQLWGNARLLEGAARAAALVLYLRRFPFVRQFMKDPGRAEFMRHIGVFRVEPRRAAFTDNRTGAFGREVLELEGE